MMKLITTLLALCFLLMSTLATPVPGIPPMPPTRNTLCPAGQYANYPTYTPSTVKMACLPCAAGYYQPNNNSNSPSCTQCALTPCNPKTGVWHG